MYTIGQFARLAQVSMKLLRYYDRIALLKPAYTHPDNGYRYYVLDQLATLNTIIALKNLGLSLKNIQCLLENPLPTQELRGMLKLKQAQLRDHIEQETMRLNEVEARLSILENVEQANQLEVAVKSIPSQRIASRRQPIQSGDEIPTLFTRLRQDLDHHRIEAQVPIGIYHYDQVHDTNCDSNPLFPFADGTFLYGHELPGNRLNDLEVAFLIDNDEPIDSNFNMRELPAVETMASVIYSGPYDKRDEAYKAFSHWINVNQYVVVGGIREVYLRYTNDNSNHPENLVEIQFPIQKDPIP